MFHLKIQIQLNYNSFLKMNGNLELIKVSWFEFEKVHSGAPKSLEGGSIHFKMIPGAVIGASVFEYSAFGALLHKSRSPLNTLI